MSESTSDQNRVATFLSRIWKRSMIFLLSRCSRWTSRLRIWASRLFTAISFWRNRIREPRTKFAFALVIIGALISSIIEAWRFFGLMLFEGRSFDAVPIFVSPVMSSLFLFVPVVITNHLIRSTLLAVHVMIVSFVIQFGCYVPGIIASVWYLIIGAGLGVTYYIDRFNSLKRHASGLANYHGDINAARQALEFIYDQSKFYIDRWIVAVLSLAAAVGVMMTILWGDSFGAFAGTRGQRLTDSIYMVFSFFAVLLLTGVEIAHPAHKIYDESSSLAISLVESSE